MQGDMTTSICVPGSAWVPALLLLPGHCVPSLVMGMGE